MIEFIRNEGLTNYIQIRAYCNDTKFSDRQVLANSVDQGLYCFPFCLHVSRDMTKPNKMSVRPAKTQISLGICPV